MGCFDTVVFKCVGCGSDMEVQDKGGECEMKTYQAGCMPVANAVSLSDRYKDTNPVVCENCGTKMRIVAQVPQFVPCMVMKVEEDEEDDC